MLLVSDDLAEILLFADDVKKFQGTLKILMIKINY